MNYENEQFDEQEEFYKGSGVLRFNQSPIITPIIESFFGHLNSDSFKSTDNVVCIKDLDLTRYDAIASSLNENAMKFGLDADCEMTMTQWFAYLCEKFNVPEHQIFSGELEDIDDSVAQLEDLFGLAKLFNDGHNLYSLEVTYSSLIDDEYSGGTTYINDRIDLQKKSDSILNDVIKFNSLIETNNFVDASNILLEQFKQFQNKLPDHIKLELGNAMLQQVLNKNQLLTSNLNIANSFAGSVANHHKKPTF